MNHPDSCVQFIIQISLMEGIKSICKMNICKWTDFHQKTPQLRRKKGGKSLGHHACMCVRCVHKTSEETEGLLALLIFDKCFLSSPTPTALTAAQYTSEKRKVVYKICSSRWLAPIYLVALISCMQPTQMSWASTW